MTIKAYRIASLCLAVVFAVVGAMFLLASGRALAFFNGVSGSFGMASSMDVGRNFFVVLSVAYMYVVTLLAVQMARHPEVRLYAGILANAKLASAVTAFLLFILDKPHLLYLLNGIVDGAIGAGVILMCRAVRRNIP